MEFSSPEARARYAGVVARADSAVVALDFDGTLAPIVDDPATAHIHPDAPRVLVDLAERVRAIAVVTGRPARQALALGGLDEVGRALAERDKELYLFGQYGNERWSSTHRRVVTPRPPRGLSGFLRELPGALRRAGAGDAYVEDKGLAVAVHTRRLVDAQAAFERLLPGLERLASAHDLLVEPGRQVIEVRGGGVHKGHAVHSLVDETGAEALVFAGDDLGDLEAFDAVDELRADGMATLLVCSQSWEQSALLARADLVVPGPEGVLDLLRTLTRDAPGPDGSSAAGR